MQANQLAVIAEENGLEKSKVEGLLSKFAEPFAHAKQALDIAKNIKVVSEDQTEEMENAGIARKELKSIRVDVEHTRKELKEQSLREGKAIDGMANIIKAMIVPVEEHLEKQEKFAENLANERKARIAAERLTTLIALTDVPSMYSYENMEASVFDKLVADLTEAKQAKIAAEQKVEAERIAKEKADAEEQERIRKENAQLKAEAEAREAALAKEREKVEQERKAAEAKAAQEKAEVEAKLKAERLAREAAEKAETDRKAEEARKVAEQEEKERQALLSPDKDKLVSFANAIYTIKTTKLPAVKSKQAQDVLNQIEEKLTELHTFINQKAKEL